jgi:hypothetical protein
MSKDYIFRSDTELSKEQFEALEGVVRLIAYIQSLQDRIKQLESQSESKDAPTDEVKNGDYVIKLKGTHHEGFGIVREAFEGNDKVSVQVFDVFGEDGEPVTATYNRKSLTKLHLHPAPAVQLSDEQLRKNEDKLDKITDWKASFRAQQKRYNRYLSEKDAEIQRLKERENELGEKLRYYADCYAKKGRELSDAQHQLSQLKSTSSNP